MKNVSFAWWCHHFFGPEWNAAKFIAAAKRCGVCGIELAPPEIWPLLEAEGLDCPLAILDYKKDGYGPEPFELGWNDPANRARVVAETIRQIQNCEKSDGVCHKVIAFSGMRVPSIPEPAAIQNCIDGIREVIPAAEKAGVTLMFEFLNDKPGIGWVGHPGYDATGPEYVRHVVEGVGSVHCKMLFDIYHFFRQFPDGDVIGAMERYRELIGHFHIAGLGDAIRAEPTLGRQDIPWGSVLPYINQHFPETCVGVEFIPTPKRHYARDLENVVKLIGR